MDKKEQFEKYMEGILQWNEKINLTAIKEREEFWVKHIIDSLAITELPEYQEGKTVLDIGTGAGFPGAILAINNPEKEFFLLDALKKRLNVIDTLLLEQDVKNVTTLHGRAEDYARDSKYRESFDIVTSRAVSNLPVLLEYALPYVKVGGYFIAYKATEEEEYSKALKILGGEYVRTESSKMEKYGISHNLMVFRKVKNTPSAYPRKAGTVDKKPLK